MLHRLGYACIALGSNATTNRGTILRNATPERLRALIAANLAGLGEVLRYNVRIGVRLFRISSDIIPFASHPVNTVEWWAEFAAELRALGDYARATDQQLSMHPSHFTVLNAPDPRVLAGAHRDLDWHHRFLDALGCGPEAKLILHLGGVYGDRAASLARLVQAVRDLPPALRARIVVENDDRLWSVDEALHVHAEVGAPVVFDWLHHRCRPGERDPDDPADLRALLERVASTWHGQPILPKLHFSSQEPGAKRGAHADYVDPAEFRRFLSCAEGIDFDCMLEAKAKDLALLQLRCDLQGDNRPAAGKSAIDRSDVAAVGEGAETATDAGADI